MEAEDNKLTYRQRQAVDIFIRDGGKSKARALLEAGYSMAVVHQPHKVFDSPAVQRELEMRGFGERKVKPEETLRFIIRSPFDFSQIPQEQIQQLKEKLDALHGEPLRFRDLRSQAEETPSYTPTGFGTDIFSSQAKEDAYPKLSSFSSM